MFIAQWGRISTMLRVGCIVINASILIFQKTNGIPQTAKAIVCFGTLRT